VLADKFFEIASTCAARNIIDDGYTNERDF
jgi:hypothetical protein